MGFCSWVKGLRSGRLSGDSEQFLRSLYHIVMTKRELRHKVKLSIYQLIFASILTCGHEEWFMTDIMTSQIKYLKWVSSGGWLASPLGIRWEVEMVRASCEDASRYHSQGGVPVMSSWEEVPGRQIISPRWPGNASGSPSQSFLVWPGERKSRAPC